MFQLTKQTVQFTHIIICYTVQQTSVTLLAQFINNSEICTQDPTKISQRGQRFYFPTLYFMCSIIYGIELITLNSCRSNRVVANNPYDNSHPFLFSIIFLHTLSNNLNGNGNEQKLSTFTHFSNLNKILPQMEIYNFYLSDIVQLTLDDLDAMKRRR